MRRLAENIANFFYKIGLINFKDRKALRFGIELIITQFFTFLTILVIGVAINKTFITIIYCIYFVWTRRTFEGYHAKNFLSCYILTILFYINIQILTCVDTPYFYLNLISFIMIYFYLKNHTEDKLKILKYICYYLIILSLLWYFNFYSIIMMCSLILFFILLLSDLGGKNYGHSDSWWSKRIS